MASALVFVLFPYVYRCFYDILRNCKNPETRFFLELYFIDYAIRIVLIFLKCAPSRRQSPQWWDCSCPWVLRHDCKFFGCSISCTVLTSPWLLCNYLFVLLNPLTSSPFPYTPHPSGNHQNSLCIHDSVSVLDCLVCFSDSVVDRFVIFDILLFTVLIFFFLNRSL